MTDVGSVLQFMKAYHSISHCITVYNSVLKRFTAYIVAINSIMFQYITMHYSLKQRITVCESVLKYIPVYHLR